MATFNFSIPKTANPQPPHDIKILLPEGQKDFCTMISVGHNPSVPGPTYAWKETEIRYKAEGQQTLYIALAPYDDDDRGEPRFYIFDIDVQGPHVKQIHYIQGTKWINFTGGRFPPGTFLIRIRYEMPRTGIDDKVILYVKDIVEEKEINCDPLVGNDPP